MACDVIGVQSYEILGTELFFSVAIILPLIWWSPWFGKDSQYGLGFYGYQRTKDYFYLSSLLVDILPMFSTISYEILYHHLNKEYIGKSSLKKYTYESPYTPKLNEFLYH